jgi:AraC family transcriptional regulator
VEDRNPTVVTVVPAHRRHSVLELKTGQKRTAIPKDPELSSAIAPWRGILLEHHSSNANELPDILVTHHVVGLQLTSGQPQHWKFDGEDWKEYKFAPGTVSIIPAGSRFAFRASQTGDFVLVQIDPEFLHHAARELITGERVELILQLGIKDEYLAECIRTLLTEAEQQYLGGRAYGESVAIAMATHLVRKYSRTGPLLRNRTTGLAPFQLRRVTDYIREHLNESVSLEKMASATGLSIFHFARMFKAATGVTPKQFVLRCRLERARELLLTEDRTISEVALEVGFCDQSHLSTHFKRLYGTTPKQFVREARR